MLALARIVSSILLMLPASLPQAVNLFGKSYTGDGTFYGPSFTGHCSFGFSDSYDLPWSTGITNTVALNKPQYGDSTPCGMCIRYQGLGSGLGLTPIPATPQFGLVCDELPEGSSGSLDLATNGDGRWKISFEPVQCAVGDTSFQYAFQGSNPYYIKLSITNTRVPIGTVQLLTGGTYVSLQRTVDNYFQLFSGLPVAFPTQVRITSIFGDTVQDTIDTNSVTGPPVTGRAQFPLNPEYSTVGAPISTNNSISAASVPSALPLTSPTATPSSSSSLGPYDQCGGTGGTCASRTTCVDSPWSGTACPMGYACNRVSQFYHQCQPSNIPGASVQGLEQGCNRTSQIYQSCGGEGDICNQVGSCVDSPWPGTCCITPGTSCQRMSNWFWWCIGNSSATPTTSVTLPEIEPGNETSVTPPSQIIDPLPTQPSSCRLSIAANQICGGTGGACRSLGRCEDSPAPGACCPSGYFCQRQNEYVHTCARNTTNPKPDVLTIADNQQCGGLIVPDEQDVRNLTAVDGPWVGVQCLNEFACQRYDAHFYACTGFPFVPPAAFNLTGLDSTNSSGASAEGIETGTPLEQAVALANSLE